MQGAEDERGCNAEDDDCALMNESIGKATKLWENE